VRARSSGPTRVAGDRGGFGSAIWPGDRLDPGCLDPDGETGLSQRTRRPRPIHGCEREGFRLVGFCGSVRVSAARARSESAAGASVTFFVPMRILLAIEPRVRRVVESTRSDEELMLAYQAGDADAFVELFDRYKVRIYNYFLRHLSDWTAAEDLFQKTFLRVHEARERYRPSASFATWVYTIATNLLRDEIRRRGVRPEEPRVDGKAAAEISDSAPGGPERTAIRRELRERIAAAVRALPPEQREAFVLGKYEGRGYREIAEILGCTEGAVKVRIHRAVKRLQQALGEFSHAM
jgi:RNA polymerase sigma-70 factor (ECF subfamily)